MLGSLASKVGRTLWSNFVVLFTFQKFGLLGLLKLPARVTADNISQLNYFYHITAERLQFSLYSDLSLSALKKLHK